MKANGLWKSMWMLALATSLSGCVIEEHSHSLPLPDAFGRDPRVLFRIVQVTVGDVQEKISADGVEGARLFWRLLHGGKRAL